MRLNTSANYALFGVTLGLAFPLVAWVHGILSSRLSFSASAISLIHQTNFALYIIDMTPFVLGIVFFQLGSVAQIAKNPNGSRPKTRIQQEYPGPPVIVFSGYFISAICISIFICIFDVALNISEFSESNSFWEELLYLENKDLYLWLIIFLGLLIFGFVTSVSVLRLKRAYKQTRQNEERISLLLNTTAQAIYAINNNGECTFANRACLDLLGFQTENEILYRNMHKLIHHTHNDGSSSHAEECKIFRANKNGFRTHVDDEKLWRQDGSNFPAEYRSVPIRRHGEIIGSVINFSNIEERIKSEVDLEKNNILNRKTIDATTSFLKGDKPSDVFTNILNNILNLTESEFGFIGDVKYDQSGAPFLKTRAITNIAWDQVSNDLYKPEGMEFRNLNSLFGHVLTTKTSVLSNSPADDKRGGGLPKGHPPLDSFLGIPLMRGGDIIGMLGVANRPGGYDDTVLDFIEPYTNVCAYILWGIQLNQELGDVKRRYETLFDDAPLMYITTRMSTNSDPIIANCNKLFSTTLGYPKEAIIGKPLTKFMTPASTSKLRNGDYNKALKTGVYGEYRELITRQGKIISTELAAIPEWGIDGEIVGTRAMYVDISEQIETRREQKRIANELTQLIDTANAPIFGINTSLQINQWNKKVARITGYGKNEVMTCLFVDEFVQSANREMVRNIFIDALSGKETTSFELILKTKAGANAIVLFNTTSRRDMSGTIIGVTGIGQDITELRRKEEALYQSQKMEAVGQLTGGIAHDFNNLLSIISGNLRFLKQTIEATDAETNELFEDAMSAVEDGSDLTQRLLGFSSNRSLNPMVKDVNESVTNFARFLSRTLGENIQMDVDLTEEDLYISVDPSQLENALLNLSINSRDAMSNGGIISIQTSQISHRNSDGGGEWDNFNLDKGNYILISVADTGSGISPEDLRHVYEPFFTTKDVGKGSGLGLSMVYGFTRQSGGCCHISSTPGQGTVVTMYFPKVNPVITGITDKRKTHIEIGGNETVLVVEDEHRLRRIVVRDLKRLGYKVLEAENANIAMQIMEREINIDLLFTDVLMPGGMDGHMLGIWAQKNYPQIKIFLTSGYTRDKTNEGEGISIRFPTIRKPYSIKDLDKQLKSTLEGN